MKKKKNMTIRDISRLSGLGTSTVSAYFSGKGYLSEKSRLRIAKAVGKTNYRINVSASLLRTKSSLVVAMLIPPPDRHPTYTRHFYLRDKFSAVLEETFAQGYELLLLRAPIDSEEQFDRLIRTHHFSAAILMESVPQIVPKVLARFEIPFVYSNFNAPYADENARFEYSQKGKNGVVTDHPGAFRKVLLFAKEKKYQALAYWDFRNTIEDVDALLKPEWEKSGLKNLTPLLRDFFEGRVNEAGLLEFFQKWRTLVYVEPPEDVVRLHSLFYAGGENRAGLLALDNPPEFKFLSPKISYVFSDPDLIGRESIRYLIRKMKGGHRDTETLLMPVEIVEGETT